MITFSLISASLSSTHIPVSLTFLPDSPYHPGMNLSLCGEFLLTRDQFLFASLTKLVSKSKTSRLSQEVWDVYKDAQTMLSSPGQKYKSRIVKNELHFAEIPCKASSLCVTFTVNYCDAGEYKLSVERDPPPAPSDVRQMLYIGKSSHFINFNHKVIYYA